METSVPHHGCQSHVPDAHGAHTAAAVVVLVQSKQHGEAGGYTTAKALFGPLAERTIFFSLRLECTPELHARADDRNGTHLVPARGLNGKVKSVVAYNIEQTATYTMMDVARMSFPWPSPSAHQVSRFYHQLPPATHRLGVLGFPHVAYYVVVEWIGGLFVSPVPQLFLGSKEYARRSAELWTPPYNATSRRSFLSGWTVSGPTTVRATSSMRASTGWWRMACFAN
jgi:hypothetical protein